MTRIDNYDGENVTFHYNRHEDNKLITETVSAVDFIKKLIIHIPEKHFKLIRYYGIYAKHHKHENSLRLFIPKEKRRFHILRNSWRTLFSCHFISTLSCASAVIKWHFFKFDLTALRFLKNLILGLILLNSDHFFKYTIHQLSFNGEIKNSITLSKVLHYLFLLCLFWLVFYYIILFQKTQFPIQK